MYLSMLGGTEDGRTSWKTQLALCVIRSVLTWEPLHGRPMERLTGAQRLLLVRRARLP